MVRGFFCASILAAPVRGRVSLSGHRSPVTVSFRNVCGRPSLALAQPGTRYLNGIYTVTRVVRDAA
jgi:hypothetical protein